MSIYYDNLQQPIKKPEDAPVQWRMSVYGILSDEQGRWFMVEPSRVKQWDLPGGGIEIDESIRDGLAREFYEETGYRVRVVGEPLYLGENPFFYKPLGFCHSVILIFDVELIDNVRHEDVVNTFDDGFEIRRGEWVDPAALTQQDVHPIYWPFIETWQRRKT